MSNTEFETLHADAAEYQDRRVEQPVRNPENPDPDPDQAPAEKFFLGGSEYNRGFYSGEVTGDSVFVWRAELQLNTSRDVQAFGRTFNLAAQFYAFYDRGETWEAHSATRTRGYRPWASACG